MNGLHGVLTVAELHSPLLDLPSDPDRKAQSFDDGWDDPPPAPAEPMGFDEGWDEPAQALQGELILPSDLDHMSPAELRVKDANGLTPRMAAFVQAYLGADGNASAAARAAGVAASSAHVVGSRWLRNSAVISAIKREVGVDMALALPKLVREQIRLAIHAKSEFVRQQAGNALIERVGVEQPEVRTGRVSVVIDLG